MADRMNQFFSIDAEVEVDGNELGFNDSWVNGIIRGMPKFNRSQQTYNIRLLNEKKRMIRMGFNTIRPIQPTFPVRTFQQGEVVEYLKNNVWLKVTIIRVVHAGNQYEIRPISSQKIEMVSRNDLRPTKEWNSRTGLWN